MAEEQTTEQQAPAEQGQETQQDRETLLADGLYEDQKKQEDQPADKPQADDPKSEEADAKSEKEEGEEQKAAPEEYKEFTVPEGMELDKEAVAQFVPVAKELGLDQDQAQKVVDLYNDMSSKQAEAQQELWENTLTEWRDASTNDKEFGGEQFDENIGHAKKALDTFGTPELKQALEDTGTGNHPEMVRLLVKIGKAIADDALHFGKGGAVDNLDAATILYPNQQNI